MLLDTILSYDFYIVAIGVCILSISSSMIGCFSVYRGQSLVGDAIGHSAYPGIILAFMIFQNKNPLILTLGACATGILSYYCINLMKFYSKIPFDSALAIALSGFFGLGLALDSFIQGNASFNGASQAGLRNYILGQAAYLMRSDLYMIIGFSSIAILLMILFYKELVLCTFDSDYAKSMGFNIKLIDMVLLVMTIMIISVGLKTVGVILISSFLIIPCIFASIYAHDLKKVFLISSIMAALSSFVGTLISSVANGIPTGPIIIVIMSLFTLLSLAIKHFRNH